MPQQPTAEEENRSRPQPPRFAEALRFWIKLGFISFGGPAGQIAIMHQELVERRRWLSERRFLHALNYCMLLPGPEAQQLAIYLGWLLHRTWGGIVAGVAFVLPSLVILVGLGWLYLVYGDMPVVAGIFYGIKPAVTAIVFHAAWRIGGKVLRNGYLLAIATGAFVAIFVFQVPFPLIVLVAGLLGALGGRWRPDAFQAAGAHAGSTGGFGPAVIDDDTPTPAHARFALIRLLRLLMTGAILWLVPMAVLYTLYGWEGHLTQMGWFFTKAALLTFGGAYAVLPYVYQGAVGQYGWVTPGQMIDGLALGETTPGPLIMVVAFVAFVGGYTLELVGPDQSFLAGALAAVLVTWFTFLFSFLFILGGGPLVESTHGELRFTAPLTGITAAVVGVIANLALFFSYHALWPQGFEGGLDWAAGVIALIAGLMLFGLKWSVMRTLVACAVAGLAWRWLTA